MVTGYSCTFIRVRAMSSLLTFNFGILYWEVWGLQQILVLLSIIFHICFCISLTLRAFDDHLSIFTTSMKPFVKLSRSFLIYILIVTWVVKVKIDIYRGGGWFTFVYPNLFERVLTNFLPNKSY